MNITYLLSCVIKYCLIVLILILVRLVGAAQSIPAQSPYQVTVQYIGPQQGLPNRTVLNIGQDDDGFIWIGTIDDVYRFDGRQMVPLPTLDASAKNVKTINLLMSDEFGNLWLNGGGSKNERSQFILLKGKKKPEVIQDVFKDAPFKQNPINIYVSSPKNRVRFIRTKDGTIWRHVKPGQFKAVFSHPFLRNNFKDGFCETARNTLLIAIPSGQDQPSGALIEVDTNGRLLRRQFMPQLLNPIYQESDGTIYCNTFIEYARAARLPKGATDVVLYRLKPSGALEKVFIPFIRDNKDPVLNTMANVNSSYDPVHGLFWLCGPNKLMAWHPQYGVVFDIRNTDFPSATVGEYRNVFVDRTGAAWVSTLNGVVVLTLKENHFRRFLYVPEQDKSGEQLAIRGMLQTGPDLWVNANKPYVVNLKTGVGRLALKTTPINLRYTMKLYPALRDPKGYIWSAAGDGIRVDSSNFHFEPVAFQADNAAIAMWHDGRKRIWFGHIHGLSTFDTDTRKDKVFTQYNQFGTLASNEANGFFPDKRLGMVWVTSKSGLYLLDTLRGIQARYSTQDQGVNYFPFDYITYVHPDPDKPGLYWVATRGGGLIYWNQKTGQYRQFTQKQGLSNNTLYAIYEDNYHRLWLPSDQGLMSFHRKNYQIQVYHTKDGIADEEFNLLAHCRGKDGQLFFGGLNGVTAFYPDRIQPKKPILVPLLVTQYQKLNTETGILEDQFADYEQKGIIHLASADRLFSLSFSLLDYRQLGKARLWYRIEGWQNNWVMQEQLDLRINGLPAGEYTLQVRAQTANGDWASSVVSIPISVDKPFYFRTWFLLMSFIGLIIGGRTLLRWRNQKLMTEKIRLEQEVARRTAQIEADKRIIEQDKAIIEQQAADLQASDTLKSRFFANVSHEFRTPLTLLVGPIQYLSQQITDANARQLLGTMERNTQQLLTLVNDLLDLSRLDAGKLVLTEKPGDLALISKQVAANFAPEAAYEGLNFTIEGVDQPCWMLVDSPKVETVLRNLLINAIHYTKSGGAIGVQLECADSVATITVIDSGAGIHPDDIPHIFERYFQTKQMDKPLQGGTGIGLALCYEYCKLWGGDLRVKSELGKGSTFTITYPIRKYTEVTPEKASPTNLPVPIAERSLAPEKNNASSTTVLIVEDHADMRFYIQTVLAPYHTLQVARNGREALELLQNCPEAQLPKLIISDIMMPEVDGIAMMDQLRQIPRLRHIPVILLTARADLDSRLQALQLGVADYLTKPFQEAELIARVRNLLQRSEEQVSWRTYMPENESGVLNAGSKVSEAWVVAVQNVIRQQLDSSLLSVKYLADAVHMSERQFYRQCKTLTGMSPNQLIQEIRLQVAYDLLQKNPDMLIKTVAFRVGYNTSSYFIQLYRERFGVPPGKYQSLLEMEGS